MHLFKVHACRPLKPLLALFLARQPGEVAAGVRTTVAVTGVTTHPAAGNVLPSLATAQLNFRYLPGQSQFSNVHMIPSRIVSQAPSVGAFGHEVMSFSEKEVWSSPSARS